MNEPGLTHLSISVDDIDRTLERVAAGGGSVVAETNLGMAVMIRDPDGQLIELLRCHPLMIANKCSHTNVPWTMTTGPGRVAPRNIP